MKNLMLALALVLWSCGGGGGGDEDTGAADSTPSDSVDTTVTDTTPTDTTPADTTVTDTTVTDTEEDGTGDVVEDTILDLPGDGATQCEEEGGYCTTYAVVSEPCVTCASVGGVEFRPAAGPDGSNECTAEGEGAAAWCCMPVDDEPPECVSSGGVCVPPGSGGDRCPVGWVADTTGLACNGSHTCCVEGDSC
jgi:hypothetical protein